MRLTRRVETGTSSTASELQQSRPTLGIQALILFCTSYLLAILYCRSTVYRDPTSFFFNPAKGYEPKYSLQRQHEADSFIAAANSSTSAIAHSNKSPTTCIGISTIARPETQYVRSAIGSLLHGMSDEERQSLHLITLIANTNPADHPIYQEQWMDKLVDSTLTYNVSQRQLEHLRHLETEKHFQEKSVFDYAYLLRKCYETGAPWVVMLEDDVIASEGWYPKALLAADQADDMSHWEKDSDWLYLRLFYTEEFLGWNIEEWPRYMLWSVLVISGIFVASVTIRSLSTYGQMNLSNLTIAVACGICVPACITLYFLVGRCSVQPLSPGVFEMPKYGCCSQALLFNRQMVPKVINYLQARKAGQIDSMVEDWANEESLVRWAVNPSLFQHIGRKSSRGDDYGENSKYHMSVAEKIWSFGFETNRPEKLRKVRPQRIANETKPSLEVSLRKARSAHNTAHNTTFALSFVGRLLAGDMILAS